MINNDNSSHDSHDNLNPGYHDSQDTIPNGLPANDQELLEAMLDRAKIPYTKSDWLDENDNSTHLLIDMENCLSKICLSFNDIGNIQYINVIH